MFGSAFKHTCVCVRAHVHTCLHACSDTHFPKFLSAKMKGKDVFLPQLSQFQHLPVWVNLTRVISFLYFFLPPKPRNSERSVFEALAVGYPGRPQPGSKPRSEVVRQQLDYDHK